MPRRSHSIRTAALALSAALCGGCPAERAAGPRAGAAGLATGSAPLHRAARVEAPTGALRERAEAVAEAFRERAARPVAERWVTFLPARAARVMRVRAARRTCLGFVAVGRESLGDIDLAVHNVAGVRIAEDARGDAHPYVRTCVREGEQLYVAVRAARGAGEVAVITVADPPVVAPNLDAILGLRASGAFAPQRAPRVAIGDDPAVPDAGRALEALVARLTPLGYRRVAPPLTGALDMQRSDERRVFLAAGSCYAIVAAGGEGVEDLDVRLSAPDGRALAEDRRTDSHPTIKWCPSETGPHRVRVHMYSGEGQWALAALAMDPAVELPADVVGTARASAYEVAGEGRRRGMTMLAPPLRGAAAGALGLTLPFTLRAGRCYLFGAAANEVLQGVELSLLDDHGAVIGSDTGQTPSARIFHCPRRTIRARVEVRGGTGRGEYVFLAMGTPAEAAQPATATATTTANGGQP